MMACGVSMAYVPCRAEINKLERKTTILMGKVGVTREGE